MVTQSKDPTKEKNIDAMRMKKYIACFVYKNRLLPIYEFVRKSRAPVEHLFNCHEWCDSDWCWAKNLTEKTNNALTNQMRMVSDID